MGSLVSCGNRENSISDDFLLIPFKPIQPAQTCQLVTMYFLILERDQEIQGYV